MRPNILMPIMTFMTRYYNSFQNTCRFISKSHLPFKIYPLILFTLVIFFIISCEKGPTQIGNKILPGSDSVDIKSIDTLSTRTFTLFDDSIRTDNPTFIYLGSVYDPYFGTATAGFVSQIRLSSIWDKMPFTLDSIKLYLQLIDVKRTTSTVQHSIKLSEISEQIYTDKNYYSNTVVPLTGYSIDVDLPALKADTINDVALTLPNSFGEYILRDTSKLFYAVGQQDFRSYFKGLYFQMDPGNDPLLLTLSIAPKSGVYSNTIVIYLHDNNNIKKEYFFALDATNRNAAFNKFVHDFSTALPDKKIKHINDNFLDTLTFLQSLDGVYTRILLPGLEVLKNDGTLKGSAVNKARLSIPVYFDGDLYRPSTAPVQLFLRYRTTSGAKYIVPDYNLAGDQQYHLFYDGRIDTINKVYYFNIPTFVQSYLEDATGQIKPELELFERGGTRNVILKGNKNKSPIKFELTYTKF